LPNRHFQGLQIEVLNSLTAQQVFHFMDEVGGQRLGERIFFNFLGGLGFGRMQLQIAELFVDGDEFPHQGAESLILRDLLPGALDGRADGNDAGDRLSFHRMSEGIRRAVTGSALPGAVASRLAALR